MNRTLEQAALLVADLARLRTAKLKEVHSEIVALRDHIRELIGPDNHVRAVLDEAKSIETEGMTKAERRDWEAKARVLSTVRVEWLECLECGKRTEALSLHVQKAHRISWDDYLAKWDLLDLDERFDMGEYPRVSASFVAKQKAITLARMKEHPDDYKGENLRRYREEKKNRSSSS